MGPVKWPRVLVEVQKNETTFPNWKHGHRIVHFLRRRGTTFNCLCSLGLQVPTNGRLKREMDKNSQDMQNRKCPGRL